MEIREEEKVALALEKHDRGYNCAQAVLCSFSEELGVEESLLFSISEGFGAGMGDMQGTCGALSGAYMAAGLMGSSGDVEAGVTKGATYRTVRELTEKFREKNGSHICKELKGMETGQMLRSCSGCIEDAVRLVSAKLCEKQ